MNNKLVIGVIVVIAVAVLGYFVMQQAGTDRSADSGTGGELMRTNQVEGPIEIVCLCDVYGYRVIAECA